MIRINLLPYRPQQRLRRLHAILWRWGGLLLGSVLLAGGVDWWLQEERLALQQQQRQQEQTIAALNEQLGEIKEINERKALAVTRLAMIRRLSREQESTIRLLDAIARSIPEQAWLTRLERRQNRLLLSGMATSKSVVADFMRQLSQLPELKAVELVKVAQQEKKEPNNNKELLNSFAMELQFAAAEPEPSLATAGGK
ncbi:MAG: PilN domain-containing protein [Magnetococcales bacterium]|nr:PilN domain-containing protein [Magnetococcales bacterium]